MNIHKKRQKIGKLGENISKRFLLNQGFTVIEENWHSIFGEIDIIVSRENKNGHEIRFIEVKSISRENKQNSEKTFLSETLIPPFQQFHVKKQEKMLKTIQTYLIKNDISHETPWSADLFCVYIDEKRQKHTTNVFYNCLRQ